MKPLLYLHIGYPKTGTSSLQNFCAQNEVLLRDSGLLYPSTGRIGAAHYGFSFRLDLGSYQKSDELPSLDQLLSDLEQEIADTGVTRVLLSSESFVLADSPDDVRDAFQNFNVKIVVYLRRHDRAFESAYAQSMKLGQAPPWDPTIESYILHQMAAGQVPYDYLTTLRHWAKTFGHDNIIVRPFEKTEGKATLYTDFLSALGVVASQEIQLPERRNSSASYPALVAMGKVQRSPAAPYVRKAFLRKLFQVDAAAGRSSETQLLSPSNRVAIVERYQPMYTAIAREFLGRSDGRLFAELPPRRDHEWIAPREPSSQELVNIIISAAALLLTPAAVRHINPDRKRPAAASVDDPNAALD